jgi:hypothetical protein
MEISATNYIHGTNYQMPSVNEPSTDVKTCSDKVSVSGEASKMGALAGIMGGLVKMVL